jgi:hypothetical protein
MNFISIDSLVRIKIYNGLGPRKRQKIGAGLDNTKFENASDNK